jgi:hypothetical protein
VTPAGITAIRTTSAAMPLSDDLQHEPSRRYAVLHEP